MKEDIDYTTIVRPAYIIMSLYREPVHKEYIMIHTVGVFNSNTVSSVSYNVWKAGLETVVEFLGNSFDV